MNFPFACSSEDHNVVSFFFQVTGGSLEESKEALAIAETDG